ncbi:MAG: AMP-binding protein, partial [Bacteroidota bacterium]
MLDNTQQTVYSVFEKQSRQYSSKVAIEHGEQVTTYEDLASRVDHLSSCMDIKTGEIVATWIDPSTDLVSAALSIFKKGAIYMPLDISAGKNRIADAFELTECRKIVTSKRRLSECVKYLKKLRIPIDCIYIIKEHQYLAKCSLLDEIVDLKPRQSDNVAIDYKDKSYIFHTSGTTGKAKSILGSHKSLLHFINWEVDTFDIQSDCRVSFLSNVTFDASLRDIFVPLCKGGTVCIPAKNIKSNLSELVQWIDEKELTLL